LSKVELEDTQINLLLNLAFLKGKRSFKIRSPLINTDLFEVTLNRRAWSCRSCIEEEELHQNVGEVKSKLPKKVGEEIPGYDAIAKVIISSGTFDAEDFGDDFANAVRLMKGKPGKYFVCLDTNVLYNRFVSSVFDPYLQENLEYYPKFMISNLMRNEIEKKMNHRYNEKEVEHLVDIGGEICEELKNQYTLGSRKAKFAHSELHWIETEVRPGEYGEEKFLEDNEMRDIRILREYEEAGKKIGKRPLVFGFENSFKYKAEDKELEYIHLKYPENVLDIEVGHEDLYRLIRYLTQLYGVIQLKGLGCRALGVWENMDEIDYESGRIKFVFEGKTSLYEELSRCEELSTAIREAMR